MQARLATFLASLEPIDDKVDAIRKKFGGAPVTATEPVFGYMAAALGLTMRNENFQIVDHERHRTDRRATSPPSSATSRSTR